MAETRVVHCKKEKYDVYIGRPSKWGNPYTHLNEKPTLAEYCVDTREQAIAAYELHLWKEILNGRITEEEVLALDGKILGCWCHPQPCHGQAIIKVIEQLKKEKTL